MRTKTKRSPVEQMIDSLNRCLTTESAKRVLKLRADPKLQEYLDELAEKNIEGTLTPEERAEYEDCLVLGNLLAMLKSKIRRKLAAQGQQ